VTHLQPIDEDVDRTRTTLVDEVQLLVAVEGVVLAVRGVALGEEELADRLAVVGPCRKVDVPAVAGDPGRPSAA
jgi:hypothetical protein